MASTDSWHINVVSDDGLLAAVSGGWKIGRLFGWLHGGDGIFDETVACITDVLVDEPYRRRGIGTALVREFERLARDHGMRTVRLFLARPESLLFWKSLGYPTDPPWEKVL